MHMFFFVFFGGDRWKQRNAFHQGVRPCEFVQLHVYLQSTLFRQNQAGRPLLDFHPELPRFGIL